ncbi:MAG: hypothetical protein EZS28_001243 [Streblomastix strix]|uniref:Uncharacterized protein n=1 Tax=Streblomastix strix TaxID=222440 RepID=A0A5J4X7M1_9EUKA|nr:MAG: hypothetical protein EZS28_001243 [Streblomastix strix]
MHITIEEFLVYSHFISSLLCVATKSDPEIELRFLLRQYNKRLKMEQLKETIGIAQDTGEQESFLKLILIMQLGKQQFPVVLIRIISSIPGQNSKDWDIIYTAVNRLQYYGYIVPPTSPMISKFKTDGSGASSKVNLMIASQRQCIQGVIQALVGVGQALVAINYKRLFQSSQIPRTASRNIQVGYQFNANVINIAFIFEYDIILYIEPPFSENPRNGKLLDYVLNLASLIQLIEFVCLLSSGAFPSILTNLIENPEYAAPAVLSKKIRSGFSDGIIQQERCQLVIVLDLFNHTTFRSYKKSQVLNYKYNDAQLRVNTGNELNIGFSQFKSSTPAIVIGYGIKQLKLPVAKASTGISMKTPQCLLPLTTVSKGGTLTEFFVLESDNQFTAITAYSLAYIDVSHSFVLSLHIAIYQNGPQAVEQPSQNLTCSLGLIGLSFSSAPIYIVRTQSAQGSSNSLKFTLALALAFEFRAVDNLGIKLSYSANLSPGIVIYQQTQHDYTIEQIPQFFVRNGALIYLYPSLVNAYLNTSDIAQYEDIQSECQT